MTPSTCTLGAAPSRRVVLWRLGRWALPIALALLPILIFGAPSLLYPFGRDQGEYACIANAALSGKVIYRDVFNVKPPLTHLVHALALVAFGRSMLAIRLLDLVWQAATVLAVAGVARRLYLRPGSGVLAAFVYAASYYCFDYWDTAQTDGWLTLPVALAVLAFLVARERDAPWADVACGALLGIAALLKYPIAILLPLLALPWARGRVRRLWRLGLGFAAPFAVAAAVLALQGALASMLAAQAAYVVAYNGVAGGGGYLASVLGRLLRWHWTSFLLLLGAAALACDLAYLRRHGPGARHEPPLQTAWPLVAWWLAALVSFAAQNKGYAYHALPLLAPQAIVVAHVALAARDRLGVPRALRLALVGLGLAYPLAQVALYCARGYPYTPAAAVAVATGRTPLAAIYENRAFGIYGQGDYALQADLEVARYIQAHSAPGDTVFIWGFEPGIYFLAGRDCASRFIYNYPLYGQAARAEYRTALMAELEARPPLYVVVVREDAIPMVTGTMEDSLAALGGFPELARLIGSRYATEAVIEHLTVCRRIGG